MELAEAEKRALQAGRRAAILAFEDFVKNSPRSVGPESCPVRHHFAPGAYAREIFMPAGMQVVGKIHRHAHVNIISQGRVEVFTEHGGLEIFEAPYTFVSTPGTKRAVAVLEDTVWTTVHVTDKTDLADIEEEVIAKDFEEVL